MLKDRLIQARKKAKITQSELGDRTGKSRQTAMRWEKGTATPSADELIKIANVLNTTVAYLTGEENSTSPNTLAKSPEKHTINEVDVINVPIVDPKITACAGEGNGYYGVEWNIVAMRPIPVSEIIGHLWQGVKLMIITIEGSSMEPKFRNGDRVLFAEGEGIKSGDIVVSIWDDRLYIRGYFAEGEDTVLKPLNPVAREIRVDKDDPRLQILGKVIAQVPELILDVGFYS